MYDPDLHFQDRSYVYGFSEKPGPLLAAAANCSHHAFSRNENNPGQSSSTSLVSFKKVEEGCIHMSLNYNPLHNDRSLTGTSPLSIIILILHLFSQSSLIQVVI